MLNLIDQISRIQITNTMTDAEALALKNQKYVLMHADKQRLGIQTLRHTGALIKPNGGLLVALLKEIIDLDRCKDALKYLRQVKGDPSNRPSIIGQGAMMLDLNKDGMPGVQNRVPASVLDVYGGKADMLGSYRYKNTAPGVVNCDLTSWTKSRPDIYIGVMPWILAVNNVYRNFLPEAYARQMAYVNLIPDERKIPGTAFTTLYVLLNAPTAWGNSRTYGPQTCDRMRFTRCGKSLRTTCFPVRFLRRRPSLPAKLAAPNRRDTQPGADRNIRKNIRNNPAHCLRPGIPGELRDLRSFERTNVWLLPRCFQRDETWVLQSTLA